MRFEPLEERRMMHGAEFTGPFDSEHVADGIFNATSMAFAPDGRLFITQKSGSVWVVENGQLLDTPFLTVPADTYWERGLGGIAFDPDFVHNGYVYVYYSYPGDLVVNRLSRFTASVQNANVADPASELVLLDNIPGSVGAHNGGAMAFGPDGMLYLGIGDGVQSANSQSLASLSGKILRLDVRNPSNIIPGDNPFVTTSGARGEIWALGFRNPFTLSIHPVTGEVFVNDVGQGAWEEINLLERGGNYGWPGAEGASDNPDFIDPLYAYHHNGKDAAIVGGAFYTSNQYPEDYAGDYFFGEFASGSIDVLDLATNEAIRFATHLGNLVDIDLGPDGNLYYLTYSGAIHKIVYAGDANRTPQAVIEAHDLNASLPTTILFSAAGSSDPDGDELNYAWDFGDGSPLVAGAEVVRTFTEPRDYFVRLTVTDSHGASHTSQPFIVRAGNFDPTASITFDTRDDFVIALYQDTLNRNPDPAGAKYWRERLNAGVSASQVSLAFLRSPEHRATQVAGFYRDILGREAQGKEGDYWMSLLAAGADARNVMAGFYGSAEFSTLVSENDDFVAAIYDRILRRAVETGGGKYWVGQLEGGLSREALARQILFSHEYTELVIADLFNDLIGRDATASELAFWGAYARSHRDLDDLKAGIMGASIYAEAVAPLSYPSQPGREYRAGDTIFYKGTASDTEDGTLPASAYEWTIDFHHQSHTHPFLGPIQGVDGGAFTIPTTGETSSEVWYRIRLRVTDSRGAVVETFQDIFPHLAQLTITSNLPEVALRLDDGPAIGNQTLTSVAGLERKITAPTLTESDGKLYVFDSWSNGGAAEQTIRAPLGNLILTARYSEIPADERAIYQFVTRIHRELTHEEIDPATLKQEVARVLADGSREPLTTDIYDSLAARLTKVDAYYATLLKRLPGAEERVTQAEVLLTDGDLELILRIVESPQYFVPIGQASWFITRLYTDFYGRAVDAEGQTLIAAIQAGATPREVALQVLTSEEYLRRLTRNIFQKYLNRLPTSSELDFWAPSLQSGDETERTLRIAILSGVEYFDRQA